MFRTALCTSALATVLSLSAAMADVTPEEVWENWQAMSTSAGQELTVGGTARNGDTLEVTDITITYKDPMGGSFSTSFDKLGFKETGDGTVTVVMPESFPINIAFPTPLDGEGPGSMKVTVLQPGATIIADGSATETSYAFTAPSSTVRLDEIVGAGGEVINTKAEMALTEASGKYVVALAEGATALDSSFAAKSMTLNVEGESAEGTGKGKAALSFADVKIDMKGNILGPDVMANMAVALNNGFTMDMGLSFGATSVAVEGDDGAGPGKFTLDATGGNIRMALDKTRIDYGIGVTGAKLVVSGPEIPFPQVEVGLGEFAFHIMGPVSKSDAPQDFLYVTKLVDLTTSEDVWGLFDPSGTLGRDPVTFVLDLKGKGFWHDDIMQPEFDFDTVEAPGELHTLDIGALQAKAAGADVTAAGGLTFDNTDLATYGGVPRPSGTITVNIKGVQALIDNLISMGLLAEDEAMGFRMMLAMFARPGAGPDELVSELEFRDGGLFANGQQIW